MTAVAPSPSDPADTHTQNFTGKVSQRLSGLTNDGHLLGDRHGGVGRRQSSRWLPIAATGTPQPVTGFWDQYTRRRRREQGGCGGGPAGVVSLLGVALALRGLRRRS